MNERDWWKANALKNIIPNRDGAEFPEGDEAINLLKELIGDDELFEYGCGRGRLAPLFDCDQYTGIDICEAALKQANKDNPDYLFVGDGEEFMRNEAPEWLLLYTVALHIPDAELAELLHHYQSISHRLMIAEVMDASKARPDTIPPAYNRDAQTIKAMAEEAGWKFEEIHKARYFAYQDTKITFLTFS
jgi:hypothetical protein